MTKAAPKANVKVSAGLYILIAIAVFFLPWDYLLAWCIAVSIHELCHYGVLRLYGCSINSIQIGVSGVQLQTEFLTPVQELLCAAAGPSGSLLLMIFIRACPALALCGMVQGLYNLLPIYPMDGGRILYSSLSMLFSETVAEKGLHYITVIFRIILIAALVYAYLRWKLGIHPLILIAYLLHQRKISCKEKPLWYNRVIPCK